MVSCVTYITLENTGAERAIRGFLALQPVSSTARSLRNPSALSTETLDVLLRKYIHVVV
jgi:hypothetical protein